VRFLLEAVDDLRSSLRKPGGDLVIRRGDTVGEVIGLARDTGAETSRLSPYLHFGCLSPLQLAEAAGPGEFTRQLAWRDFFRQVKPRGSTRPTTTSGAT
jgi:deoxyribodipyrimidine photolyase